MREAVEKGVSRVFLLHRNSLPQPSRRYMGRHHEERRWKKISFLQLWESLGGTCRGSRWLWRLENRLQRCTLVCCCHLFLVLYPHCHRGSLMLYLRTFQDKKWYPLNMFLSALASFSFSKSFCLVLLLPPELNATPNSLSQPHLHIRASRGSYAVTDQQACKETTWWLPKYNFLIKWTRNRLRNDWF